MSIENQDGTGGHTPVTPPPAGATPAGAAPADAAGNATFKGESAPAGGVGSTSGARTVAIITAVVGGLALLGSGGTAAAAAVSDLSRTDSEQTLNVDGIEGVDLDASASEVTVRFGDTDDATLTVSGGRGDWTLQREGDELVVRSPHMDFDWWFGGNWFGGEERVLLTLPESVAGIDADLNLSAGNLDVEGDFGEVTIGVGAGSVRAEGSATTLTVDMSAGTSDMEFEGVSEADILVAAGDMNLTLTGAAPDAVDIDVSAGSLTMLLPDAEYNVLQDVSAGSLDSRVDESSSSERTIDVSLSAGNVTLRPGS